MECALRRLPFARHKYFLDGFRELQFGSANSNPKDMPMRFYRILDEGQDSLFR